MIPTNQHLTPPNTVPEAIHRLETLLANANDAADRLLAQSKAAKNAGDRRDYKEMYHRATAYADGIRMALTTLRGEATS